MYFCFLAAASSLTTDADFNNNYKYISLQYARLAIVSMAQDDLIKPASNIVVLCIIFSTMYSTL